jgi:PII-like signaling protein
MELNGDSKLLRIFIGENDKIGHQSLYEAILMAAKERSLAGCTVLRGIMSYGASSRVHTARLIDISQDLPIIVEIVDKEDKINAFVEVVDGLLESAACGGLITIEKAGVLYYKSAPKKRGPQKPGRPASQP